MDIAASFRYCVDHQAQNSNWKLSFSWIKSGYGYYDGNGFGNAFDPADSFGDGDPYGTGDGTGRTNRHSDAALVFSTDFVGCVIMTQTKLATLGIM